MVLYLKLSDQSWDATNNAATLGISLDERPGEDAYEVARLEAVPDGDKFVKRVTVSPTRFRPVPLALKIKTADDPDVVETVVVTVKDISPRQRFTLQLTLTRNLELTIESQTIQVRVVTLSLALARLALPDNPSYNCRASLDDGQHCRLQRVGGGGWCARHTEVHRYIYKDTLKGKLDSELDIRSVGFTRTGHLHIYSMLQRMIALRIIITHALYGGAGAEDDGHVHRVACVVGARHHLDRTITLHNVDHSGRKPVKPYLVEYLAAVEEEERRFDRDRTPKRGEPREVINLQDVKKILERLRQLPDTETPSLSEVFCEPGSTQLYNEMLARLREIGDLPRPFQFPPAPGLPPDGLIPWGTDNPEERAKLEEAYRHENWHL